MTEPILRDAFPGWETGNGIFGIMAELKELPWENDEEVDNKVLDVAYFGNHSGAKFCSPIVKFFYSSLLEEVPLDNRIVLAKIILSKYFKNWKSLWLTNIAEYNPIHNYDMVEERIVKRANSESEHIGEEQGHTGTDTFTHGKINTVNHGRTTEEIDSRYGFDTANDDPKPSDKFNTEEGGSTVSSNSGSDINTRNLLDTTDSSRNKVGADEEEESLRRSGNIGVTTTQQMLESERRLWLWNYFDQIFEDLDKELALKIHDPCRV